MCTALCHHAGIFTKDGTQLGKIQIKETYCCERKKIYLKEAAQLTKLQFDLVNIILSIFSFS
jgi:hypothetical protein